MRSPPLGPGRAAGSSTLTVDSERAHAILHDIAVDLARVAVGGPATRLHVEALALKREISRWTEADPDEAHRSATIDELLDLHKRVKKERGKR